MMYTCTYAICTTLSIQAVYTDSVYARKLEDALLARTLFLLTGKRNERLDRTRPERLVGLRCLSRCLLCR